MESQELDEGLAAKLKDELEAHAACLPEGTTQAWLRLAPIVPDWFYLSGGTALAVHLHHRVSRDLDLFAERDFDAEVLAATLSQRFSDFVPQMVAAGTVNGVIGSTKVQFLAAPQLQLLHETETVAGLRVSSVEDVLATKIKVIVDRAELRDYFDLMRIETDTELNVVDGVRMYLDKYRPAVPAQQIEMIVRSFGYFDDVAEDPGLPVSRDDVVAYWKDRQPSILRQLVF
ncbi:nucleotidyl transferase AbiEii/AbiGii toxin family protein [Pseudoclavibacter soli]|uniref:nucleotidyl transferase AbiEii/AbiGii toxin family protein n=1 Tax=Pseudoclavibacter soli TaxID=452623 RepID=UPI00047F5439|nr:nucleotidyl transferase AbiEii/AbiGii toxin family protein [Pseudoclavibacter soli]